MIKKNIIYIVFFIAVLIWCAIGATKIYNQSEKLKTITWIK